MAKRRFSSAQLKRLKDIQAQRLARSKNITNDDELSDLSLGPEQSGVLITHNSTMVIVKSQDGKLFSCTLRQNLGALVTGDNVIWQAVNEHIGVVIACEPRRSVIMRPDLRGTKPIVANVDLMVVVVALAPLPQRTTIDRYLILAQMMKLNALIVINKFDLFNASEHQFLLDQIKIYEHLGYKTIKISSKTKLGFGELTEALKDINSILVGQSGAGKSSLLNSLVPDAQAQIGALSSDDKLGRQTTTASKLYHLPAGGNLIDSPGIHQFNLRHFTQEQILKGFEEFAPFVGKCQFRNCLHAHEPNCALIQAAENGEIAPFRLENYHAILLDHA
jgi:ribosome biogenesis GTPase